MVLGAKFPELHQEPQLSRYSTLVTQFLSNIEVNLLLHNLGK